MTTTAPLLLDPAARRAGVEAMFPTLTPAQTARLAAHGRERHVADGEVLVEIGRVDIPCFVLTDGRIDYRIAAWVTGFELLGVGAGVRLAHAVSANALRRVAATLCVAVGLLMLVRAW